MLGLGSLLSLVLFLALCAVVIVTGTLAVSCVIVDLGGLERLLQVLIACLSQRREAIVDQVLLPVLVYLPPLAKLLDETLMNPINFEEWPIAESVVTMSVAVVHHIVVDGGF